MLDATNTGDLVHGMTVNQFMFDLLHLLLLPAIAIFLMGMALKAYVWTRGGGYRIKVPLNTAIMTVINNVLLQRQVLDLSIFRWVIHMCIFWGFMGLFAMSGLHFFLYDIIMIDDKTFLAFNFLWFNSEEMFPQGVFPFWKGVINELFGFILLFGVVAALARRFIARPEQLLSKYMDVVSLAWLLVMTISGFVMEGVRMIAQGTVGLENLELGGWMAAQGMFAAGYSSVTLTQEVYEWFWIFHIVLAVVFLLYLPFSKLLHIITSPVIDYFNNVEEAHGEHITTHEPLGRVIDERVLLGMKKKKKENTRR